MSLPLLGVCFFGGLTAFFYLLGRFTAGNGADLVDWDPLGHADARRSIEQDDIEQMLETANRRRRAQGLDELSEDEVLRGLQR